MASEAGGADTDADASGLERCLRLLELRGFVIVSGTPQSVPETEALASRIGLIQDTFYGHMWDTGGEVEVDYGTDETSMIDTAYSSVALPLHTDNSYLENPPGLQIFNCVAQAPVDETEPLGGSTRLADGWHVAEAMRREAPESFRFFSTVPLPFSHVNERLHTTAIAPVFKLHPLTGGVVEFRYNETDRAPLDTLSFEQVEAFYEHSVTLARLLSQHELVFRLRVGDALVFNNRRVLHGRHAFRGRRNLVGCYLTADDWRARLRLLRARSSERG